jgi:hypothetical protein
LEALLGHSITYRIAVGPNEGRKAFTLQTVAAALSAPAGDERLAKRSGFSLHAGVAAAAHQRDKVERLCRYIARPAVATGRLALTAQGQVRYTLKTPYRDGTTHVMFEPLDFIARLATRPTQGRGRLPAPAASCSARNPTSRLHFPQCNQLLHWPARVITGRPHRAARLHCRQQGL